MCFFYLFFLYIGQRIFQVLLPGECAGVFFQAKGIPDALTDPGQLFLEDRRSKQISGSGIHSGSKDLRPVFLGIAHGIAVQEGTVLPLRKAQILTGEIICIVTVIAEAPGINVIPIVIIQGLI